MKIERGLFDRMVLQRNAKGVSEAAFAGTTPAVGGVSACVRKQGQVMKGFGRIRVGTARGGAFSGCLKGVPAGGPYDVELAVQDERGGESRRMVVRNVLVGDVWILAGQSNMQGCGFVKDSLPANPKVRAFFMDDQWRVAKEPMHNMWKTVDQVHIDLCGGVLPGVNLITGTCPGLSFADRMLEVTKVPQGLIACAHGGTSMAQWDPGLKGRGSKSLYGAMMRRLTKNGGRAAGVVWYQGESDAGPGTAEIYTDRMKAFVAAVRRDFGQADLPFVLVQIGRCVSWGAMEWNVIQDQQRLLPGVISRCQTVPAVDLPLEDAIHISGKGQVILGRRLADAMLTLTTKDARVAAPIELAGLRVVPEAERGLGTMVVEFAHVEGKLVSDGMPRGFTVKGPDGVEQAFDVRLDGKRVVIRTGMTPDLLETAKVWYGLTANPVCNIRDSEGRPLPVFGPVGLGTPRASSGLVKVMEVSRLLPSAGKLDGLRYPGAKAPWGWKVREFPAGFCDLHGEIGPTAPSDHVVYYRMHFECAEGMRLHVMLGYDGPAKLWIDGKERYHDPKGTNPARPGAGRIPMQATPGRHEVVVALGTNAGRAWGIFLSLERSDVRTADILHGREYYVMPKLLAP